jgi:hypothetical protein
VRSAASLVVSFREAVDDMPISLFCTRAMSQGLGKLAPFPGIGRLVIAAFSHHHVTYAQDTGRRPAASK